jgi:hypothetical protein
MLNLQSQSRLRSRRIAVASSVVAALALSACGGSDGGGGGGSAIDMADSFPSAAVCNGEPHEDAPDGGESVGYVYLSDGEGWSSAWFDTFGDAHAVVGDDANVILCATVTASSEGQRCEFEDDGDTFTLVMMEATYDVELRRAVTANVVGRDSVSAPADECPFITSWSPGEGERQSFPKPADGLQPLIDTFFG